MRINFTSKETKFPGALKGFVEESLTPLEKIEGPILDVEILVDKEKLNFITDILVKTKSHSYQSKGENKILKQSIRKSIKNIKNQIKRNKSKVKDKKRIFGSKKIQQVDDQLISGVERNVNNDRVALVENFSAKPVTVKEAVFFLKESGERAFLFRNDSTKKISVIYFNSDETIAMIEEKFSRS